MSFFYGILKHFVIERNFLNSCFVTIFTVKKSFLWYSKTAHDGKKLFKFIFCHNLDVQLKKQQ